MTHNKMVPIAIVGVSALVPGAQNSLQFWRNIVHKKDQIKEVPESHWLVSDFYDPDPNAVDKTYCKRGAFIDPIDFDYREFGIPPNNLSATDSNQLLSLIVAKKVLHDATHGNYANMDLSRVSVILGLTVAQELAMYISARLQRPILAKSLRRHGIQEELSQKICDTFASAYVPWQENTFPGLLGNIVAGRIANRFNLGGTNCTIDAACASGLAGVALAANELALHKCDMAISGGADSLNDPFTFVCFSKTPALSPTGDCRPFSQEADGTLLGEGITFFALKRLEDAERDGQHIYGVIRGIGSSSDGRSKSIYAPAAEGQCKAVLSAYESAGYGLNSVELIEAHGTATRAGDIAEFNGLTLAFNASGDERKNACAIGSIKSQLGHAKGASGAISLLKTVMALHHKVLPPTIKINKANSQLQVEKTPIYFNTDTRPWVNSHAHPWRAGVSSFGFGGSNFHITVEEYLGPGKRPALLPSWPTELVIFSAETTENLVDTIQQVMAEIPENGTYLSYIARKSQLEVNTKLPIRLAIVAKNDEDLKQKLTQSIQHIKLPSAAFLSGGDIYYSRVPEVNIGKIAFLFPGQGSQYVNMGKDITLAFPSMQKTWDEFAKESKLANIVFPPPVFDEQTRAAQGIDLTKTENAQPALGLTSIGLFDILKDLGIKPDYLAGHSFGEISALCAAGAYNTKSMLSVASKRGALMMHAGPGAMLAVACSADILSDLIRTWDLPITITNYNSPQQLILSGPIEAINSAHKKLTEKKITNQLLPVSGSFHSQSMEQAGKEFLAFLQTVSFTKCHTPVYANVTGQLHTASAKSIKELLANQLFNPVQFQKIIESMYQEGVRIFVEVGPGSVLTKLVQQCLPGQSIHTIALDRKNENGMTQLWNSLAKLFIVGVNPNFNSIWRDYMEVEAPVIKPSKSYTVKLTGTTYGKPYPAMFEKDEPVKLKPRASNNEIIKQQSTEEMAVMDKTIHAPVKETTQANSNSNQRLELFELFQQQTLAAQTNYQKLMVESHLAFLKTTENTLNALLGSGIDLSEQQVSRGTEHLTAPPKKATVMISNEPIIKAESVQIETPIKPYYNNDSAALKYQPAPTINLNVVAAPAANPTDELQLKTILLEIISEKTGYPIDMLDTNMSLEADLGIDSIKRVEILAGLQERIPNMPEADPTVIPDLKTLDEIIKFIAEHDSKKKAK